MASDRHTERNPCSTSSSRGNGLQYRHLNTAPVDQTSASAWLYKHTWIKCQRNKPNTSMTHVACDSKCEVMRSSMHPFLVSMGCAVVYNDWAAHTISAVSNAGTVPVPQLSSKSRQFFFSYDSHFKI